MANQLKAVVTADIRQFTRSMDMVGASAGAASVASIAAFGAIVGAVAKMSNVTLDAAEKFETLRVRMQLLSGDMVQGGKEFDMIREKAKFSSFETDKLIDAYIKLKATAGTRFATEHLDNIGYAAKVAGQDISTMASRVGELSIRIQTGLTGGLLKRSLRTFTTSLGREGVLSLIKMVDAGASADEIVQQLEKSLARFGKTAKQAIEASAGGKKAKLGGIFTDLLAGGGEGETLDNYKAVLDEITNSMLDLQETDAFKTLAESMSELWANIMLLVKSDGFKQFLVDTVSMLKVMVDFVSIIVKSFQLLATLKGFLPTKVTNPLGSASQAWAGSGVLNPIQQSVNQMEQARVSREAKSRQPQPVIVINGQNENAYQ